MGRGGKDPSVEGGRVGTEPTLRDSETQEGAGAAFPNSAHTSEWHELASCTKQNPRGKGCEGWGRAQPLGQQFSNFWGESELLYILQNPNQMALRGDFCTFVDDHSTLNNMRKK